MNKTSKSKPMQVHSFCHACPYQSDPSSPRIWAKPLKMTQQFSPFEVAPWRL